MTAEAARSYEIVIRRELDTGRAATRAIELATRAGWRRLEVQEVRVVPRILWRTAFVVRLFGIPPDRA